MRINFIGKFYDNHSLSIVNRNLVLELAKIASVTIVALDSFNPDAKIPKDTVAILKELEKVEYEAIPDVEIRHSYPPIWKWPQHKETKVIYIQPWEYPKVPFEWQYKFETFADGLIVPSNYIKTIFENGGLNPYKIEVAPNGINTNIFNNKKGGDVSKFGIDKDKFNFVYVGNSQWRKGLEILLNQWPRCFKKADNARLIIKDSPSIYGKTNLLSELLKIQHITGCAEIIYIDDNLSDIEMADIYKASKVVVHPYRAEGFGMHIQEAMACGNVPIVSANGPTEDFIPKDVGLRINVTPQAVDITDRDIFATKAGDAMSLMSSHTFINEPDAGQFGNLMAALYHDHNFKNSSDRVKSMVFGNTWETIATQILSFTQNINSSDKVARNV